MIVDAGIIYMQEGYILHNESKQMANNELTIEQLQSINGGGVFAKLDGFSSRISRSNQWRVVIHPDLIVDPIYKVGLDVVSGPLPDPM